MRLDESRKLFDNALNALNSGDILNAFDLLCDSLISRATDKIPNLDFYLFYRTQLVKYLRAKKSLTLSLAEGDMISDLILSSYEKFIEEEKDNPFIKSAKGRFRLLMSVKIVFPVQNDTMDDDYSLIVSK